MLSLWSGANEEAWFNFDKLQKYRKIKNPETHAIFRAGTNQFYLLSVDVGRIHDQTVVCVFRVNISGDGRFATTLVNVIVLGRDSGSKTFERQAIDIKKIIKAFNPREVVIDTNGLILRPFNQRWLIENPLNCWELLMGQSAADFNNLTIVVGHLFWRCDYGKKKNYKL